MKVAILGFGSVGQGVAEAIGRKDLGLSITAIADSRSGIMDIGGISVPDAIERKRHTGMVGDPSITPADIIASADYDVLVEVTPTNAETGEPGLSYIRDAIGRGKDVVTSNKGPIALAYHELLAMAKAHGITLKYEATVCGAIPLIHTIHEGLAGNEITALHGVFNGTCNFILNRMADEGLTYEQALAEARELGIAEADPTYDVEGIDAAIKLVILANTVWEMGVTLDDVDICGIDQLTPEALNLAAGSGCTIRLIGEVVPLARRLQVSPRIIPLDHHLVVEGTLNAVMLETDMAGEITLVGKGAGSTETASAIIGDLLSIRNRHVKSP